MLMRPHSPRPPDATLSRFRAGLSARLIGLTILFVLLAEVLIYVPSVANFRNTWLGERLSQARAAALILEKAPPDALPKPLVDELLAGMETKMIALRIDNMRRLLAISDMPPPVDMEVDLRERHVLREIGSAFDTLIFGGRRTIRVVGPPPKGGDFVEIIINEAPLRAAMIKFSWNILLLSLVISGITALLVFGALSSLIVRPVKRLAEAVTVFRRNPSDARTILEPAERKDEIGTLERNVAEMQQALQQELRQREHLANLGLAVAKVNHDLRNMLASAQLVADRISALPDPNVQRFVPRLLGALDRAIAFCQTTLAYGKAQERAPQLRPVEIAPLVAEVSAQLQLGPKTRPALRGAVPTGLVCLADAEHLNRVLTNLARNSAAALETAADSADAEPLIEIRAHIRGGSVEIDVSDNGPGIHPAIRARLFQAFAGSSRPGGTGLGLAIAHELMRAMGGSIALSAPETGETVRGTTFRLTLPTA